MSNRYADFALHTNVSKHLKAHIAQPTNDKEQRRKNRVDDMTETPKKIWGNEDHRRKIRQVQDAMNYRNEADRIHGMINANRVPANRHRIYLARHRMLTRKYQQIASPLIAEAGVYHHVN